MFKRISRSIKRLSNELQESYSDEFSRPIDAIEESPSKQLIASFLGALFLTFLYVSKWLRTLPDSGQIGVTVIASLTISYILFSTSGSRFTTSLVKIFNIMFFDFRINYFIVRDLVSIIYFISVAVALFFFMYGILITEVRMIMLPFPILLVLRVVLEIEVASFVTAENTSIISTRLDPMSSSIQNCAENTLTCAENTSSIDQKIPEPPKVTSSW